MDSQYAAPRNRELSSENLGGRFKELMVWIITNMVYMYCGYCLVCHMTSDFKTLNVISHSGTHAVLNTGDILYMSPIGQKEHLHVGDIVSVIDKDRGYQTYTQKVTKIYQPREIGSPLVEIQYQAEDDDTLQHRSYSRNELYGKLVFRIPYIGLPYVLVDRYSGYLAFVYFLWNAFN